MMLPSRNLNESCLLILIFIWTVGSAIENVKNLNHHYVKSDLSRLSFGQQINRQKFNKDIFGHKSRYYKHKLNRFSPFQYLINRLYQLRKGRTSVPSRLIPVLRPNRVSSNQTHKSNSHLAPKRKSILFETDYNETLRFNTKTGNLTVDPSKLTETQIELALNIPGVRCGTVPLFEKIYSGSLYRKMGSQGHVRILHGLDSLVGEWPWMVRISECDEDESCSTCTGTLLSDRWVITAGHCAFNKNDTSKFKATLGLYDLIVPDNISFTVDIDKLIVHPDYKDLNHDLTLIRLAQPVKFNNNIQPACLIKPVEDVVRWSADKVCYNVGYGLTDGMLDALRLQKLKITGRNSSECNRNKFGLKLKSNTVCIGPTRGQTGGSCKGDSGGPDLCYDAKTGQWVIFGVVSYGPSICDRENEEEWLTVSVDLSNYRSWILKTILTYSL